MITFPNAKINLGLNIVSKRPDGYHNLETIFYPIPLSDVIEIKELQESNLPYILHQKGIAVCENDEQNLIIKAYLLLKERYNLPSIQIYTYKGIPSGAGMGGGSADAAFMLKLLNDYFDLKISVTELESYAARLGADCAFFIQNKPIYAEGIGNIFSEIDLDLSAYELYVHKPDIFVSTADAFSKIKPQMPSINLKEVVKLPVEEWKKYMVNDFEESVFSTKPELAVIKESIYKAGALYAAMSGSGSSIYGLFKKGTCTLPSNPKEHKYLLNL